MKKLLIAILFPAIAIHSAAQEVQPVAPAVTTDTITKTKIDSVPTIAAQTDSLKITKKPKRKKERSDTAAYNPYQPNNTVTKPLPYNSYKEKEKPLERPILPLGDIIRDVIVPKKNN